jgi:hypothetical protein
LDPVRIYFDDILHKNGLRRGWQLNNSRVEHAFKCSRYIFQKSTDQCRECQARSITAHRVEPFLTLNTLRRSKLRRTTRRC